MYMNVVCKIQILKWRKLSKRKKQKKKERKKRGVSAGQRRVIYQ